MTRIGNTEWDHLLTVAEVAELLRVHPNTLRNWAAKDTGPRETRIGSMVRYAESDVQRWMRARRRESVA